MPIKTLTNMVVTYNANDISAYLNQASLEIIKDAIDTTNLASTAKETTPAAPGFSVPIGGFWMAALDAIIGVDAAAACSDVASVARRILAASSAPGRVNANAKARATGMPAASWSQPMPT